MPVVSFVRCAYRISAYVNHATDGEQREEERKKKKNRNSDYDGDRGHGGDGGSNNAFYASLYLSVYPFQ